MKIKLITGVTIEALSVHGGKEQYQSSNREYLEFTFNQDGYTVEELDNLLVKDNCTSLTLIDSKTNEQFIHEGYIIRGPIRVFLDKDGLWKIGIKRYQQTEMEKTVELLQVKVKTLIDAQNNLN